MLLDTSYDLTSKWPDLDFEDFSKDVTRGQPADYSSDCKNTDDDDADSEKNGYGCDTDGLTKYLNEDMTTRAHQGNNTLTQRQLAQQPKRSSQLRIMNAKLDRLLNETSNCSVKDE